MARSTSRTAALTLVSIMIVSTLGLPTSIAAGLGEAWETAGFPGWTRSSTSAITQDCVIGQSGCSAKITFAGTSQPTLDRANLGIAMGSVMTASTYVFASGASGNQDFDWSLDFNSGNARIHFTAGNSEQKWVLYTNLGDSGAFFAPALPSTWYRAEIVVDTVTDRAQAKAYTLGGTLAATSNWVSLSSSATSIERVAFVGHDWGGGTLAYNFDTLVIGDGTFELRASPGANVGEVALSWDAWPGTTTAYKVYRGTSSGSLSEIATVPATQRTYTDVQLANGTTYFYKVGAQDGLTEVGTTVEASSKPKADTVTGPIGLTISPTRVWTGDPTTASFSYTVTASQCPTGATCPVENEWRIYLDGTTGVADGTLLASGRKTHAGHGEATTFSVSTPVNPSAADGAHKIKAAVQTRTGSTQWNVAEVPITIDAPLPGWMSGPATPSLSASSLWPGQSMRITSSYTVFQKVCKASLTCPVTNDWKILLDGTPGAADGTVLFSGSNNHPAHGETQAYSLDRTYTFPLITPGTHLIKVAARPDQDSGYTVVGQSFTIRGTEATTTTPQDFLVHPPYMFSGNARVAFNYSVTSMTCAAPLVCDTTSNWQIKLDGSEQNGDYSTAAFDGTTYGSGPNIHPSHGESQKYAVERTVTISALAPGQHWVKAGVREIDTTDIWRVKTGKVVTLVPDDADNDGVPDSLEEQLCGREVERILINRTTAGAAGACASSTDYLPPANSTTLTIPSNVIRGPDADQDGFPAHIDVYYTSVHINRTSPTSVKVGDGGSSRHIIDAFDDNGQMPVISIVCTLTPVPTGVGANTDADRDGFPAYAVVSQSTICVDRRTPSTAINPATYLVNRQVDPDDGDPNNPLQSYYNVTNIPTNATFSKDLDRDGVPGYRYVGYANLSYDRRDPSNPVVTYWTEATKLDPDDTDRNTPILFAAIDRDEDFIPDGAEPHLCVTQDDNTPLDGTCTAGNYVPPSWFQMVLNRVFE